MVGKDRRLNWTHVFYKTYYSKTESQIQVPSSKTGVINKGTRSYT